MTNQLRILVLEDQAADAELLLRELRENGLQFTAKRVWTEADFLAQLRDSKPDLILADYSLPTYDGLSALAVARKERPDVPFIIVSGVLGEETAIEALHHGATDFVLKPRLSRLGPAVQRALRGVEELNQRKQAEAEQEKMLLRQQGISDLEKSLLAMVPLEDKLRRTTDSIVRLFDADFCRIWLIGPGDLCNRGCIHAEVKEGPHLCRQRDRCLHLLASSGRYTHTDGQGHRRVPLGCYKIGRIASGEDRTFLTNDVQNDPGVRDHSWTRELGLVSFAGYQLGVPGGEETLGVLALFAKHPISAHENALLEGIGSTVGLVVQQATAEKALRDSETRYRTLFEASADGILIADIETRGLKYANPALCRMLGYAQEELRTMDVTDLHPKDAWPSVLAEFDAQARGDKTLAQDLPCLRKDGTIFHADISTVNIPVDGRACNVGFFRDITERTLAIDKIREQAALLDQTQDAITVHGLDGHLHYWNKGAERLYGWTPPEAVGQKVDDLLYHEVSTTLVEARRRVCESGEWNGELQMTTKMGRRVVVQSRWRLVCDDHRQADRILVVDTDITERKRIESQFLRAQRLESVGRLASGIAHDLNNVLAPILMSASLLRDEVTSESGRAILQTIDASAQRGADIVKQVLTFARGAEGQKGPLLPVYLMKEMAKIIRETFPKLIKLETDLSENPWSVTADATQLHQVLMNLCVNARDAMPDGGTLTLGAENVWLDENYASMVPGAAAGPHVLLTISDTGTGIPAEDLDRIFDPFFTTKGPEQGTGLGLSTALGIVKSHGGFIQVMSKLGQGAQFRVYLPATATESAPPAESPTEPLPRGRGELILVVDDEDSIRSVTSKILELHGYRVLTACEGTEALALYAQHRGEIQLVVTDLIMPFMDGLAAIRAIRNMDPQAKIIATSGHGSKVPQGLPSVSASLAKPFSTAALLQTLHKVLRGEAGAPQEGLPAAASAR